MDERFPAGGGNRTRTAGSAYQQMEARAVQLNVASLNARSCSSCSNRSNGSNRTCVNFEVLPAALLESILPAARDPARPPMMRLMLGDVIRAGKEFHQHKSGYEPADMSPESDAAALSADINQPADKLDQEPVA